MKLNPIHKLKAFTLGFLAFAAMAAASDVSDDVTLQTDPQTGELYVNMVPVAESEQQMNRWGTLHLTIPDGVTSFKVYDDGGKNGNYGEPVSYSLGVHLDLKAPVGKKLWVHGSTCLSRTGHGTYNGDHDRFSVYESGTLHSLGDFWGKSSVNVLSQSNTMDLYLGSERGDNDEGLDLTVEIADYHNVSVTQASGGTIASSGTRVLASETVTLTATPNAGYVLGGVNIQDDAGRALDLYPVIDFIAGTAKFVMPNSNVNVIPVFTSTANVSAENGFYLNIENYDRSITIPDGVSSFKVYDIGGKDWDYAIGKTGTLLLTAPTLNHKFRVTGSVQTYNGRSRLSICDLLTNSCSSNPYSSTDATEKTDIETFITRKNQLTLRFAASASAYDIGGPGLDLKVELIPVVSIDQVEGGSMTSDKISADEGEKVILTATPKTGYVLKDIIIKDKKNNVVNINRTSSFVNTVVFSMPNSDVTVTPVFTNDLSAEGGLFVNMPCKGSSNFTVPSGVTSFNVYDNGGKNGDFTGNCNGKLYVYSPAGYRMDVTGTVTMRKTDYLYFYNGITKDDVNASLFATVSGNQTPTAPKDIGTVSNSDSNMTFLLETGATQYAGLDLKVTLVPVSVDVVQTTGGTVTSDKVFAYKDENVTLTTEASDNYVLAGIEVKDGQNNVAVVGENKWWQPENTFTFAMPNNGVTVTPSWTNDLTAENGLFVNMPASGNMEVAVPSVVKSFYVYDDGGKDGDYSWNADGSLTLTVEDGYVMQVTGSVKTYGNYGIFKVLDGGADGKKIFEKNDNSFSITDVGTVTSKSNTLMFKFESIGENDYYKMAGLDLKVTLVKSEDHAIELVQSSDVGDVIAKDKETARWRDTVTIAATSKNGHLLSGVAVLDEDKNPVEVECGWYTGNKASFVMPNKDVTVTPTFTDDLENLYVNIPSGGTGLADIVRFGVLVPENVKKFKVYDDGGKDGDYGMGMALATFAAPEGSSLQMTGKVTLGGSDQLAIYKNSNGSVEILFASNESNAGKEVDVGVVHGDTLLLMFVRNGQNNAEGFAFDVKVISPDDPLSITPVAVTGGTVKCGTVECDKLQVVPGDVVTLTAEPEEGYLLTGFEVYDSDKHSFAVRGGDFVSNSGTFEMPSTDVFVKPLFTDDKTGLFVTMSERVDKFVTIPAGVTSFNVYDDGGKGGDKSANGAKTNLYITPAEGTAFQISGKVSLNSHWTRGVDSAAIVRVSDGAVLWSSNDRASGQKFDVPELVVGGAVRFYLYSAEDDLMSGEGFDFDVTVLDATVKYAIAIPSDGSVESDKVSASAGEIVTLTAKPGKGEILRGIEVSDDVKNMVRVDSGSWYSSNAATFTMPAADVTVAPSFTTDWSAAGGLYVNMPQAGLKNVTIPAGVTSFKVYDDGGKDENFTGLGYGEIVMTAPKGYVMQVSGTVIADGYGKLIVYDGDNTDAGAIANVNGEIKEIDIGTKFTSGNKMRIYFGSKNSGDYDGIDLTVQLVESKMVNVATLDGKETAIINGNFAGKDAIEITTPVRVDSIAFQRTFTKVGADKKGFSTIVLPFDFNAANLEGVMSVIEFTGMTENEGNTAVGMGYVWCSEKVQEALEAEAAKTDDPNNFDHCYNDKTTFPGNMQAYRPYMVQMSSTKIGFKSGKDGITLEKTPNANEIQVIDVVDDGVWVFRGTTEKKVWTAEDTKDGNVWAYAAKVQGSAQYVGQFVKLGAGAYTPPLRAYMVKEPNPKLVAPKNGSFAAKPAKVNKSVAASETASLDNIDVVIVSRGGNGEEHRTVIGTLDMRTGEFKMQHDYDLKGRKVNGVNKARGVYYGKKVLKK